MYILYIVYIHYFQLTRYTYLFLYKRSYTFAKRNEKGGIAIKLVEFVMSQDPPGRFVECLGSKGDYFVVDYERAMEKTCQALREKVSYAPPPILETKKDKEKSLRAGLRHLKKNEEKAKAAAAAAAAVAQNSRPKRGRPPSAAKGSSGKAKKQKLSSRKSSISPSISSAPRSSRSITSAASPVERRPFETPRVKVAAPLHQSEPTLPPAPAPPPRRTLSPQQSYFVKLRLSELQSRKALLKAAAQQQWTIPEPPTTGTDSATSTEVFFILAGLGRSYNERCKPSETN